MHMPEQTVAVDLGLLAGRVLPVSVAVQHRQPVPVHDPSPRAVGVDLCTVQCQLPKHRLMQVATELADHARPVFLRPHHTVIVVAEQQMCRLVFVDEVHPRINVGRYILETLLIVTALP